MITFISAAKYFRIDSSYQKLTGLIDWRPGAGIVKPWISLVEGGEGSFISAQLTNKFGYTLSLLFCKFINTTAYHTGRFEPSSP